MSGTVDRDPVELDGGIPEFIGAQAEPSPPGATEPPDVESGRAAVEPDEILILRRGPGANCSSIGSALDILFLSAVAAGAVLAGVAAAFGKHGEPKRDAGNSARNGTGERGRNDAGERGQNNTGDRAPEDALDRAPEDAGDRKEDDDARST